MVVGSISYTLQRPVRYNSYRNWPDYSTSADPNLAVYSPGDAPFWAEDNVYFYFDEDLSLGNHNENSTRSWATDTNPNAGPLNSSSGPANNTGRLHFINPPDYETKNKYEVKVAIKNGQVEFDEFTIEINDVNEPPEITSNTECKILI